MFEYLDTLDVDASLLSVNIFKTLASVNSDLLKTQNMLMNKTDFSKPVFVKDIFQH